MNTVAIGPFIGELAAQSYGGDNPGVAMKALNADLSDGTLRPVACPEEVCRFAKRFKSFYYDDCCGCVPFPYCTTVVDDCTGCGLLVWVDDKGRINMATPEELCEGERCLAVRCPSKPLTLQGVPEPACEEDGCLDGTSYVYTFVNQYGQESGPSPATATIPTGSGVVDLFIPLDEATAPGFCIDEVCIYRTESGDKSADQAVAMNTNYFLVGCMTVDELIASQGRLQDSTDISCMGEALTSINNDQPEYNLCGIIATQFGNYVAWEGTRIHFSRARNPSSWPSTRDSRTINVHEKVECVVEFDRDLFVFTKGCIYRLYRIETEGGHRWKTQKFPKAAKFAGKQSIACGKGGIYFATDTGPAALIRGDRGGWRWEILEGLFTVNQWKALRPDTMKGAFQNGHYLLGTATKTLRIPVETQNNRGYSSIDIAPEWFTTTADGRVLFLQDQQVLELPECYRPYCDRCCEYEYERRLFIGTNPVNLGAFQVFMDESEGQSVTVELIKKDCDFPEVVFTKEVTECGWFHLPSCYMTHGYCVRLTGCANVHQVIFATSAMSLGAQNAA